MSTTTTTATHARANMSVRGQRVVVSAPREVLYDLDRLQKLQAVVLGKLGHAGCYSGYDIRWRQIEELGF